MFSYFYGYLFVHSLIYLLLIITPMYFFLEKNNAFTNPSVFLTIIYLAVNFIYHTIILKIFNALKTKKSGSR